jgi:hypothetical protein
LLAVITGENVKSREDDRAAGSPRDMKSLNERENVCKKDGVKGTVTRNGSVGDMDYAEPGD